MCDDEGNRQRPQKVDAIAAITIACALIAVIIVSVIAPSHLESALTGLATLTLSLTWASKDARS